MGARGERRALHISEGGCLGRKSSAPGEVVGHQDASLREDLPSPARLKNRYAPAGSLAFEMRVHWRGL